MTSNLTILAYEPSPLGMLCLRRRELLAEPGTVVTEVTLDHEFLMSSHFTASERALAAKALEIHRGSALRVLVGGLGLGYTAREALASPRVDRVEVVEFLPQVIGWLRQGLVPLSDELNAEPRLDVEEGDVYQLLLAPARRTFDLVLIDVDHSPSENLAAPNDAFYTEEGLVRVSAHLAPRGVLGVWSASPNDTFASALRTRFDDVRVETVNFRNTHAGVDQTDWLYFARRE